MEKEFFLLLASAFGAGAAASFTATRFMSAAHVATLKQQLEGAKDESRRSVTERDGLRTELKGAKDDLAKLEERRQIADQRATILSEEASSLKATVRFTAANSP